MTRDEFLARWRKLDASANPLMFLIADYVDAQIAKAAVALAHGMQSTTIPLTPEERDGLNLAPQPTPPMSETELTAYRRAMRRRPREEYHQALRLLATIDEARRERDDAMDRALNAERDALAAATDLLAERRDRAHAIAALQTSRATDVTMAEGPPGAEPDRCAVVWKAIGYGPVRCPRPAGHDGPHTVPPDAQQP